MTGMITLSDGGQNYIEFDVVCDVIVEVRPSRLSGWNGTKILNSSLAIGDILTVDLQWDDYDLPLQYPIVRIDAEDIEDNAYLLANMSADPALYTNPTTEIDHMAYVVEIEGIPLYFDCISDPAIAAADALLNAYKIPSVLMSYIDGIQLVGEQSPGGAEVVANIVDLLMTIFGNRTIDIGIIAHEATHPWASDKWGSTTPPADSDYMAAINSGEPAVSEYALTTPGEDLAESIRLYVMDQERLKSIAPLRFDAVNKLMTDPGYYG